MMTLSRSLVLVMTTLTAAALWAEEEKPMSPRGTAAAQVGGQWSGGANEARRKYEGGKWLEVDYGRPLLRGRTNVFGKGADYGKAVCAGAPVWRAGANQTTRFHTDVSLDLGGKKIAAGDYDLFVELKVTGWTLIVSTQGAKDTYKDEDATKVWGAYGYDAKYDVARVPMKLTSNIASLDQLTWSFEDVGDKGGKLVLAWEKSHAAVAFTVAE